MFRNIGLPGFHVTADVAPSVFLKLVTTEDFGLVTAGAGDSIYAVSQRGQERSPGLPGSDAAVAASAAKTLDIYGPGDYCSVVVGATVTRGQWVKSDASGAATPHTTGGAFVAGQALNAGAVGALIKLYFNPHYISL